MFCLVLPCAFVQQIFPMQKAKKANSTFEWPADDQLAKDIEEVVDGLVSDGGLKIKVAAVFKALGMFSVSCH